MHFIGSVVFVLLSVSVAMAESKPASISDRIDQLLEQHFSADSVTPAPRVSDEDFLRRVYLDLTGRIPSPRDVTVFGLDPDAGKRSKIVDELLATPKFAEHWGSYWKEVVMSRATEQRARIAEPAFERWLIDQFANDRPWDEMTRTLLTATGSVRETGETGFIFAHTGDPQELAAEISRIFLGIQMSCANCHDHPTDAWQREQFHELAAFLPRISVRREEPGDPGSWAVRSYSENRRSGRQNIDLETVFRAADRNRNGFLDRSEAVGPLAQRFGQLLETADNNKDGRVSKEEFEAARPMPNQQQGRGELEYYMPDLSNPASQGTLTQPVFFLTEVRGPQLRDDADDLTRRHALADYVTSPTNPWFAKAFVNRIWSEMLGQGFYTPIDDIGPERTPVFGDVLDLLAQGFIESGYDVKWVYRTIANTQAYQRQMRQGSVEDQRLPFAVATPSRLRSDQLYESLFEVLGATPSSNRFAGARGNGGGVLYRGGQDPGKALFSQVFGVDPSTPQEDIIGNVPQALFMMNSPQIEQNVRGVGNTRLARLLEEYDDDTDALHELYLMVLSREPSAEEVAISTEHIASIESRSEAFEDIMWSLLNSTEFLSKR